MKLITFILGDLPDTYHADARVGVIVDDLAVVDLQTAHMAKHGESDDCFIDMLGFLDNFDRAKKLTQEMIEFAATKKGKKAALDPSSVKLLSPVPRPRSLRDCMSFKRHYIQAARTIVKWKSHYLADLDKKLESWFGRGFIGFPKVGDKLPIYYKSNVHSVIGPEHEVFWPGYTKKLDFELEFGVFIGKKGKDIPVDRAHEYIAGYSIFNDYSARDIQFEEMGGRLGPTKGKDFDTGNAIGPCIVTADEIADPKNLKASVRVNGETWTSTDTTEMSFSFDEIISYISTDETLYPGEFIGSGTLPGGCGLELDRWIQPGDVVELEVEGIGVLRNRIVK